MIQELTVGDAKRGYAIKTTNDTVAHVLELWVSGVAIRDIEIITGVGRAVPPLMMEAIASHIWETILKPIK